MALESFYGGKQGVSPVIKARFKYINTEDSAYQGRLGHETVLTHEEAIWLNDSIPNASYSVGDTLVWSTETLKPFTMDECLKDVNYTDVWYGELCIIDTDNKLNSNNGKIYRRTLKQVDNKFVNTEDTLYAEYIGQIVGPSGGIPQFDFGSLDSERKKAVGNLPTYDSESAPLDNSNWDYSYIDNSGKITAAIPNSYEDIAISNSGVPGINNETATIQMVPGKDGLKYNDNIRYTWCNVRRKFNGGNEDAWIYLGFEIPYTFYDVTGEEENYTYNGPIFIDNSEEEHPFYKNYDFHIPRGARGIGPERLFVVGKDGQGKPTELYAFDSIDYDQTTDNYFIKEDATLVTPAQSTYWVAKWNLYNPKTTEIVEVYQYIGAYKDISAIRLQNNGDLEIQYSDSSNWNKLGTLTWITEVAAAVNTNKNSTDYGKMNLNIHFNNNKINPIDLNENLHLIKNINYNDSTGQFTYTHSGNVTFTAGDIEYTKNINIDVDKNSDTYGNVTGITNKENSNTITTLPLIKDTVYDNNTGIITFNYSGMPNGINVGVLSYISKMKILENGTVQYQLNTESGNTWHDITDGAATPKSLKIKDIKTTEIRTDGHLWIQYRDNTWEDLGQVRGNSVAGIVYTMHSNENDGTYDSVATALNELQNKIYNDTDATSIGGNGDGRIKVNNIELTGGLVAAQIKEGDNDPYSAIYYYNNNTDHWINAGVIGGAVDGDSSNIYIQESTNIYPEENAAQPKIFFVDGTGENPSSVTFTTDDFSPWTNKQNG